MLRFDGVVVSREGVDRLGPVTAEIDPRRLTVILGHNGAGKSLFLRLAHGLIAPEHGRVTWSGQPVARTRAARGFMFQATPVMRRSVASNLAFPLVARRVAKAERRDRVAEMLALAQLEDWAQNPAATLSGGEKQRLALARALITRPGLILMDEPSASLDPAATLRLEEMISEAHQAGTGIVLSTHDLGQAARLAQDVLLFEGGLLSVHVPARDFFADEAPAAALAYRSGALKPS